MIDLLVDVLGQLVRSLIDFAIAIVALPPATQSATKVPTSSELRAFFESRNAGQPPPDWLARVEGAAGPSMQGGYASVPTAPTAPTAAAAPATQHTSSFVEQERETNPNFGIVPPAPHPVERTWENLPPSPARTGTVDVTALQALHLEESTPVQAPRTEQVAQAEPTAQPTPAHEVPPAPVATPVASIETLPLSPARTGTVNVQEFEALHLSETAHVGTTPHAWDSLPLSPAHFGTTAPAQPTATQPAGAHIAVQQSSAEPEIPEHQPDWPELPQWPPPSAQPSASPRAPLRDGVDVSWYV
jgi:hypothetical protein